MQPTPFRLSQALWTAFRAAKPVHRPSPIHQTQFYTKYSISSRWPERHAQIAVRCQSRLYSDKASRSEIERKAEEAKKKIDESLDSRADIAQDAEPTLKSPENETIVHTLPEASSIVHSKESGANSSQNTRSPQKSEQSQDEEPSARNGNKYAEWASDRWQKSPLPSQIASLRSRATKRFSSFMDNFQSNIVVAAHHINDLTGYSGIERLKKEIEEQENNVQAARQHVKDSRTRYSEAIAMRSATQREVNDLLHRKHTWSPTDLERFTNLYRSDHANEQSEQKAHQTLSEAEAHYEEASTRLAKGILARYHEEQIWSDKIRQMSTWGTWGLMGLNVLLFIVFQIAIEPWRRRRLVRGFEEKVQAALDEKEKNTDEKLAIMQAQRTGDQVIQDAVQKQPEGLVATAAEEAAEAIADAITGAAPNAEERTKIPSTAEIENAAEQVTDKELADEAQIATAVTADNLEPIPTTTASGPTLSTDSETTTPESIPVPILERDPIKPPTTWQAQLEQSLNNGIAATTNTYAYYKAAFIQLFNEKEHVVLSKRELTTKVFEAVAAGIAVTCGVMFVIVRAR